MEAGAVLTSGQRDLVEALGRIEAGGARVRVATGDVADEAALQALLAALAAEGQPLRGVLHCAVAMTSAAVREMDLAALQSMFAAKIHGTEVLDRLTRDASCDLFVLFSSTTALLGVAGLGHYAAANQFMDALAARRRRAGHHALSIDWGTWDVMRVASVEDRQRFAAGGMRPMPAGRAIAAMEQAIAADLTHAVIADIDWTALKPLYEARRRRPFLSQVENIAAPQGATAALEKAGIRAELDRANSPGLRRSLLEKYLSGTVASVLGTTNAIAADRGFFDMGMDSLMAVDLRSRLERDLGMELPSTLTFNYPSVAALTDLIDAGLGAAPGATREQPASTDTSLRARIEAASRADAEKMLTELVVREAAAILGRTSAAGFPVDRGLFDMGMDSLMAVDLKGRLEKSLACELPSTFTFNYPTAEAMVGFMLANVLASGATVAAGRDGLPRPAPDEPPPKELDADELAEALRRKLDSMQFGGRGGS
jgi:acyl carrier protein/NADP-dependent 3-hydroxy acid dehydrogenase YdfG